MYVSCTCITVHSHCSSSSSSSSSSNSSSNIINVCFIFLHLANLAYKAAQQELSSLTKSEDVVHPYRVALGIICLQNVNTYST